MQPLTGRSWDFMTSMHGTTFKDSWSGGREKNEVSVEDYKFMITFIPIILTVFKCLKEK